MRFERKFRVAAIHPRVVEQVVRNHPAGFRTIYPDRQINNVYFDTFTMAAFRENVDGVADRRKFRVRWYGDEVRDIRDPRLEVKIKANLLGRKETHPVDAFSLDDLNGITQVVSGYTRSKNILQPTLLNAYRRSYLGTSCGKFRLTIDWQLRYFPLLLTKHFSQFQHRDEAVVVELKYDEEWDDQAVSRILPYIPFRYSRSSKYVTGLSF